VWILKYLQNVVKELKNVTILTCEKSYVVCDVTSLNLKLMNNKGIESQVLSVHAIQTCGGGGEESLILNLEARLRILVIWAHRVLYTPRKICWYQLNRRRLGDLRSRSGCYTNDVLLSEVAVDISILKLRFSKNWRMSLFQCCCLHSIDVNGSDLLAPYTVWRIWHIPTFQMNAVPSTSMVMAGVPQAWK
jgi:hypothetical protein